MLLVATLAAASVVTMSVSPAMQTPPAAAEATPRASSSSALSGHNPAAPTDGTRLADGAKLLTQLQNISVTYADRYAGNAKYLQAMDFIADQMTSMGLTVEKDPFGARGLNTLRVGNWPTSGGSMSPSGLANVCGYYPSKDVTKEWVILGAHYDATEGGGEQAALDNGSGTAVVLELARLMSQYEWGDRVLVFCLWGGEEDGVVGSTFYASQLANAALVQMYVNLDMVGLVWPAPNLASWRVLHTVTGPAPYDQNDKLQNHATNVRDNLLGFPDARFMEQTMPTNPGCLLTDYVGFQAIGVPYFVMITGIGNPMCNSLYPIHTPTDSFANFVSNAGGTANAQQGLANQADYIFYLVSTADGVNFRVPV